MDGRVVLGLLNEAREAINNCVGFSRSFANQSGLPENSYEYLRLSEDALDGWVADCAVESESANRSYHIAMDALGQLGYPVPFRWLDVCLREAQVAFAELPVPLVDGKPTPCLWVIGCGTFEGAPRPAQFAGTIQAGEIVSREGCDP